MTQEHAERRVRGLQKEFLQEVEAHPILHQLDPTEFNDLRKRVFRGTFMAYRLGVVGLDRSDTPLWGHFFGWLENHRTIRDLDPSVKLQVTEMCFRTALESYRIGAMVAAQKSHDL